MSVGRGLVFVCEREDRGQVFGWYGVRWGWGLCVWSGVIRAWSRECWVGFSEGSMASVVAWG